MSGIKLGKFETVFSYAARFILQSWPNKRPGILFLTDSDGRVVNKMEMLADRPWNHKGFDLAMYAVPEGHVAEALRKALTSGTVAIHESDEQHLVAAVFPLRGPTGRVQAAVGLAAPSDAIDFDLVSYLRGLEPLLRMGHDALIQHQASRIVAKLCAHGTMQELLTSLTRQIRETVQKGECTAVKLSEDGCFLPHDWVTTREETAAKQQIDRLIEQMGTAPVKPVVADENRVAMVPIRHHGTWLYALFLHLPPEETQIGYDLNDIAFLREIAEKAGSVLWRVMQFEELQREAKQKDMLYQLMSKIQASIDVNEVLHEIVSSTPSLYPNYSAELFLTVETDATIPVKQLSLHENEQTTSVRAYQQGRLFVENVLENGQQKTVIAAPLLGKQGIYGVLQLASEQPVAPSPKELDYISMLADTAGKAFENAQLYHQSRNLIRELKLINEMARQLNRSLNLKEILEFVTTMMRATFDAQFCAILRRVSDTNLFEALSSNIPEFCGKTLRDDESPLKDILANRQTLMLSQLGMGPLPFSWMDCCSLMGVPLFIEREKGGVLLVADPRYHFFSFDDYKLLEIFGQHASLAMTNAILHMEMERMVVTDNLTSLYTRRYLNEQVRSSLKKDGYGSLILIDIDYFKQVNDTYGHQVGDEVLIQVANLIRKNVRETDIAARWGGEELAIYLPRVDEKTALAVADRIRCCVEKMTKPQVTISSGVAKWTRESNLNLSVESLFHQADVALYEAKKSGRNQVVFANA